MPQLTSIFLVFTFELYSLLLYLLLINLVRCTYINNYFYDELNGRLQLSSQVRVHCLLIRIKLNKKFGGPSAIAEQSEMGSIEVEEMEKVMLRN